jgi:hypothetical protein
VCLHSRGSSHRDRLPSCGIHEVNCGQVEKLLMGSLYSGDTGHTDGCLRLVVSCALVAVIGRTCTCGVVGCYFCQSRQELSTGAREAQQGQTKLILASNWPGWAAAYAIPTLAVLFPSSYPIVSHPIHSNATCNSVCGQRGETMCLGGGENSVRRRDPAGSNVTLAYWFGDS